MRAYHQEGNEEMILAVIVIALCVLAMLRWPRDIQELQARVSFLAEANRKCFLDLKAERDHTKWLDDEINKLLSLGQPFDAVGYLRATAEVTSVPIHRITLRVGLARDWAVQFASEEVYSIRHNKELRERVAHQLAQSFAAEAEACLAREIEAME